MLLVTLVCCYAACWGPTKTRGVSDVIGYTVGETEDPLARLAGLIATSSELPLVVGVIDFDFVDGFHRHYYFWFFGYVAKLPFISISVNDF